MKYFLLTIYANKSTLLEDLLDNNILKEYGFFAKFNGQNLIYDNILIPYIDEVEDEDFILNKHLINTNDKYKYSIYSVFKDALSYSINFQVLRDIDDTSFDIFYTDGSYSKNNDIASYGCCKLLEESEDGIEDYFTKKKFTYKTFNGQVTPATNNVGELTGIKIAVNNFSDKQYQLVISDSIYSIKCFREWIYNWKQNGYKGSNKKEIKNKDLIISTFEDIKKSGKTIIFKWTKGHAGDNFNEICDQLAKQISGGK